MTSSRMGFAISTPSPSMGVKSSPHCYFPNPRTRNSISQRIRCIPQLGLTHWNGLKLLRISVSQYSLKIEKKCRKGNGVYASLFGVGAPEALVIGVVALLVFGPKGLAEVARNLGKTLRAFQPTIRELQEVSREFKSTLEREIGLDDIDNPVPKRSSPNTATKPTSEDQPESSGTNLESNSSSTENGKDSTEESLRLKADLFRGTLAQLQKEQEEEKEREKEKEKAQSNPQSQTPSPDTPQALDTPPENSDSSVTPPSQNPDGNALQETTSVVVPTGSGSGSTPKSETQT